MSVTQKEGALSDPLLWDSMCGLMDEYQQLPETGLPAPCCSTEYFFKFTISWTLESDAKSNTKVYLKIFQNLEFYKYKELLITLTEKNFNSWNY